MLRLAQNSVISGVIPKPFYSRHDSFFFLNFFLFFIYDRHTVREREREAETQAEGEAGSMQGTRGGT